VEAVLILWANSVFWDGYFNQWWKKICFETITKF